MAYYEIDNLTFFPENLPDWRYDDDVHWIVCTEKDWKESGAGKIFSEFSVAVSYCREHSNINFVMSEV